MSKAQDDALRQVETTCGSLLYELQIIWDEVGETESDKDKMLLELERECLEVYRQKVDKANRSRAQLRQAIADSEAELAAICSAMGERPVHIRQSDQNVGSLKEELATILPQLEEMQKRKSDRRKQFIEILEQIDHISHEIHCQTKEVVSSRALVDEADLSLRKFEELQRQLGALQKEKSDRLEQIQDHLANLHSLCSVLGMDFKQTVSQVSPSLGESEGPINISNLTIEQLATAAQKLRETKIQRMQKLQDLATAMLELWNLMDTPVEEQQDFQHVTCNIAASEHEITELNSLSIDVLKHVEAEVSRLDELKSSKMKELVLKKRSELDEVCRKTHMVPKSDCEMEHLMEAIESGVVDPAVVLEQIELQIAAIKEEALSRKEVLEKVEKWSAACDEECWLEEYSRDENRYNAGRGAHLTLKRAEKARNLVNKLPGMVEALATKTLAWEQEKGAEFLYDGIRLLSMLEEYTILRQEKEEEKRRQRDQKKLQGQLIAEQEALYGSKPSPLKPRGNKKAPRMSTGGASSRRLSLGGQMHQTSKPDLLHSTGGTPQRPGKKTAHTPQNTRLNHHQDDSFIALTTGRRGLDNMGFPVREPSINGYEPQSPLVRKPFSPISATVESKANITTHLKPSQTETLQKPLKQDTESCFTTPLKNNTAILDEQKQTPKVVPIIPMPSTPATVSVPMQTAMTPAHALIPYNTNSETEVTTEYSFEERRLAFMVQTPSAASLTRSVISS